MNKKGLLEIIEYPTLKVDVNSEVVNIKTVYTTDIGDVISLVAQTYENYGSKHLRVMHVSPTRTTELFNVPLLEAYEYFESDREVIDDDGYIGNLLIDLIDEFFINPLAIERLKEKYQVITNRMNDLKAAYSNVLDIFSEDGGLVSIVTPSNLYPFNLSFDESTLPDWIDETIDKMYFLKAFVERYLND